MINFNWAALRVGREGARDTPAGLCGPLLLRPSLEALPAAGESPTQPSPPPRAWAVPRCSEPPATEVFKPGLSHLGVWGGEGRATWQVTSTLDKSFLGGEPRPSDYLRVSVMSPS